MTSNSPPLNSQSLPLDPGCEFHSLLRSVSCQNLDLIDWQTTGPEGSGYLSGQLATLFEKLGLYNTSLTVNPIHVNQGFHSIETANLTFRSTLRLKDLHTLDIVGKLSQFSPKKTRVLSIEFQPTLESWHHLQQEHFLLTCFPQLQLGDLTNSKARLQVVSETPCTVELWILLPTRPAEVIPNRLILNNCELVRQAILDPEFVLVDQFLTTQARVSNTETPFIVKIENAFKDQEVGTATMTLRLTDLESRDLKILAQCFFNPICCPPDLDAKQAFSLEVNLLSSSLRTLQMGMLLQFKEGMVLPVSITINNFEGHLKGIVHTSKLRLTDLIPPDLASPHWTHQSRLRDGVIHFSGGYFISTSIGKSLVVMPQVASLQDAQIAIEGSGTECEIETKALLFFGTECFHVRGKYRPGEAKWRLSGSENDIDWKGFLRAIPREKRSQIRRALNLELGVVKVEVDLIGGDLNLYCHVTMVDDPGAGEEYRLICRYRTSDATAGRLELQSRKGWIEKLNLGTISGMRVSEDKTAAILDL